MIRPLCACMPLCLCAYLIFINGCADYDLLDNQNPPPSSTLTIASIHDSTVTLRWTQCNDDNFKNYKVYYDTNDVVDMASIFVDSLSFAMDTTKTVRGLKPATAYYFRVITTNQAGKISASNIVPGITWLSFLPSTQAAGDSGLSLKWTGLQNRPVNNYLLYSDSTNNVDATDSLVKNLGPTVTSWTVSNLPAGKTRYFRVFAKGDSGVLAPSTVTQVNGWNFPLYDSVFSSDTAVALRWPAVAGARQYRVFRDAAAPVDTADTLCPLGSATDNAVVVGKLTKGSSYAFKVFAFGSSGCFAWTNDVTVKMQ